MIIRLEILVVATLALCFSTAPASAQTFAPTHGAPTHGAASNPTRVDPTLRILFDALERQGPDAAIFGPDGYRGDPEWLGATLRFDAPLEPMAAAALERRGVRLIRRADGSLSRIGTIYRARLSRRGLDALADYPGLLRAEATWRPVLLHPLDATAEELGARAARMRPLDAVGSGQPGVLDGTGTLIVDIDSGLDLFHPHFFRADGPLRSWLDVDADGRFTPGTDAVDLDDDAIATPDETLQVLDGADFDRFRGGVSNNDGHLDPRLDWLYADLNGDGRRNVGVEEGFTEEDLAYGEPIFVVDDVDGDGMLELDERLVQLGTSKIRAVTRVDGTYTRGVDLIDAGSAAFVEPTHHGTGVASILLGGQPGYHTRIGIAPGAELLFYDLADASYDLAMAALDEALQLGADVALFEWASPIWDQQDGSTNLEAAMDAARAAGMVQVTPVGNLNRAEKHAELALQAGQPAELHFQIDAGFDSGGQLQPYDVAYGSLFWRGDQMLAIELVSPQGHSVALGLDEQPTAVGEDTVVATHELSARGTHHVNFTLFRADGPSLSQGIWTIRLTQISADARLMARIDDSHSSWSPGVRWLEATPSFGSACYPSTADSAFGVAAYGGRSRSPGDGSDRGELRNYSGRGPRIDGEPMVDLAAPDDPFAALSGVLDDGLSAGTHPWFAQFGGTSGAGPHVAAAAALLKQQHPQWGPDQIEARLRETARREDLQPPPIDELPDRGWGYGKLDVYRALFGTLAPRNADPMAKLEIVLEGDQARLDLSGSDDPNGDPLQYRFDLGYDDDWEQPWSHQPQLVVSLDEAPVGTLVRAQVRDAHGARHGALGRIAPASAGGSPDAGGRGDAGDADVEAELPGPGICPDGSDDECEDLSCSCRTVGGRPPPLGDGALLAMVGIAWIALRRRHS